MMTDIDPCVMVSVVSSRYDIPISLSLGDMRPATVVEMVTDK